MNASISRALIPDESLSMVFLLAVLIACVVYGRNAVIPSALLALMAYNFLAAEPRARFNFAPVSDALTIVALLAVALITSCWPRARSGARDGRPRFHHQHGVRRQPRTGAILGSEPDHDDPCEPGRDGYRNAGRRVRSYG